MQRESCRVHPFIHQSVHTNLSPLPFPVHRPRKNLIHLKNKKHTKSYSVREQLD